MKSRRNIATLIIVIFSMVACSKEESLGNLPKGDTSISAQIGEEEWKGENYESSLNVVPDRGQFFELTALNSNYKIEFSVLEFKSSNGTLTEGIYKEDIYFSLFMVDEGGDFSIKYKAIEGDADSENSFSINITASTNSRISGTFSGMVKRISEGGEAETYPEILIIANGVFNNLPFETRTVNIQ